MWPISLTLPKAEPKRLPINKPTVRERLQQTISKKESLKIAPKILSVIFSITLTKSGAAITPIKPKIIGAATIDAIKKLRLSSPKKAKQ